MSDKKPRPLNVYRTTSGDNTRELYISDPDKTPSWRVNSPGHANFRVIVYGESRYLSISLAEYAKSNPVTGKGGATKETMMSLDETAGRALYAFLGEIYGADVAPLADAETV